MALQIGLSISNLQKNISNKMKKILFILLACVTFVGCKQIKYVEVDKVHTDSIFIHTSDTIKEKVFMYIEKQDSVHEREYVDSMGVKHKETERFHNNNTSKEKEVKIVHDSIFIEAKVDSIPIIVEVEKELAKCEKVKMVFGEIFLWFIGFVFAGLIGIAVYFFLNKK